MSIRFLLAVLFAPAVLAAQIEVAVVDVSGAAVANPYAAIVAADVPWRTPLAEKAGAPIRFEVPPGTYRLVVAAPGFMTEWRETFVVRDSETSRVTLQPLAPVSGRVVDGDGKPVANARIASYFDRLPDHPRQLSPLAERHLQINLVATSDADGYFELGVPASRETVVLVEADRMAPRIVDSVSAGSDRLSTIVLERGASLAVRLESAKAAAGVELIPVRAALDPSLPSHRVVRLWRRAGTNASWTSLPLGTYDIAIRERASADPVVVTRIELTAGTSKSLTLPPPAAPLAAGRAVIVAPRDRTLAVTRWRGGVAGAVPFTSSETGLVFDDCRPGDVFLLATRDLVGSVRIESCDGKPVTAAMHDRASLQVRFDSDVTGGTMTAGSCDDGSERMEVPFAAEKRTALVPFPAGCSAVSIAAAGFRRTDAGTVHIVPGQTHLLAVRALGRAASLLVRARDFERLPAAGIRIAVVDPESLREVRSLDALDRVPRLAEATTDAKGWASFRHLGDEPVQLLAWTEDGRTAHLSPALRLTVGDERIEQLDLELPGSVRVEVPRDADSEGVELVSVNLEPVAGSSWPPLLTLRAPVGAEGAVLDSVPAGAWIARGAARIRGGHLQNIGRTEIHVQPGATVTATLPFASMVYRGKVTGGLVPVNEGVLYLESHDGSGKGNQAVMIEDGRFAVLLEEPGKFTASIQRRDGSRIAVAEPVVFESSSKETTIRLGDTRIAGIVENVEGVPIADMRVYARRNGDGRTAAQARSDGAGRFSFDDLAAGTWTLVARNDHEQSAEVTVEALPGRTADEVRLVVRELHRVRGKVVFANGTPAAHATLLVRDTALGDASLTATADERGEFELRHTASLDGKVANVFVRDAAGGGFVRRIALRDGMTIAVPRSGTVRFRRDDAPWRRDTMTDHILIAEDGAWVHPINVGRAEGDRFVAALSPGVWHYVVLSGPEQRQLLRSGAGASLPALATFLVQESSVNDVQIVFAAQRKETK